MHFESLGPSRVELVRGDGRILSWDISIYGRTKLPTIEEPFGEINRYLNSLDTQRQEVVWSIYESAYDALNTQMDISLLSSKLSDLVKTLYEVAPLEEISNWVRFHEIIQLPKNPELKDQCGPEDDERTIQRTFLKTDYISLVCLAVSLRLMIPIWGEYIVRIKDEVGPNFKEFSAMRILSKSALMQSHPMNKLKTFVESYTDNSPDSLASVLDALGSTEKPEWLLAMVIVRRVAPVNLLIEEGRGNIITNIYAFVNTTLNDIDRRFGGTVKDKFPDTYASDDDKTSEIELYKVKQAISIGDVSLFSVYTEEPFRMAMNIDPTVDPLKVRACLEVTADLYQMKIDSNHLILTQWVINPVIKARAVNTLNKAALLRTMAVVQAILWHWGHLELALLVTAVPQHEDSSGIIMMESRTRIPTDLVKQLGELYPYTENIGRSKGHGKGNNVAVKAIQMFSRELSTNSWGAYAPVELVTNARIVDNTGIFITPANIMELLARLVVQIATPKQSVVA